MRTITKGHKPPSLTAHRQKPHCDYDNYPDTVALQQALVSEQRGICCYCMGRIQSGWNAMKIEHWRCQTRYPAEQLDYRNLLGACRGGEDQPPDKQHCDTRKGDRDLRWNPADPVHHIETNIRYQVDGSISSDDPGFNVELVDLLNLNLPLLKNNRKGILGAVLAWWQDNVRGRNEERRRLEQEHCRRIGSDGDLEPFCQVAIWWTEQRLAKI